MVVNTAGIREGTWRELRMTPDDCIYQTLL